MRYDVAVRARLRFHTQAQVRLQASFPEGETVLIEHAGRRFVWHNTQPDPEGHELWPTVTIMVEDADDYEAERVAMERFLSALAYWTDTEIEGLNWGGAGWAQEFDRPVAVARRRGLGDQVFEAPGEVVVEPEDDQLRLVLAHHREGLNAGSPFFRFLAFWNALDVGFDGDQDGLRGWICETVPRFGTYTRHLPEGADPWDYLYDSSRNAVAHAIRTSDDRPALDPDLLPDRGRLMGDSRLLQMLVKNRVAERWGQHAVWVRRRPRLADEPAR
jgi:hypothetical protein